MSSRCLSIATGFLFLLGPSAAADIRVCADPDNLPYSDRQGGGFQNRILELIQPSLPDKISYVWWNDRRASAIEALMQGRCDLVPGSLLHVSGTLTTRPYMRSAYAFVTRAGDAAIRSFDDPRLRRFKIGVQSVGDDAVTPPVQALLHHGLVANLRAYTLHGHYDDPNSAGGIVDAVARSDIDAAVLWGPFAGYYAALERSTRLSIQLVSQDSHDPQMSFAIAMATRVHDEKLRDMVDAALSAHSREIDDILNEYSVPLLPMGPENSQ